MIDARTLEDMAKRFVEGLPAGVRQLQTDLEKNFQVALQGAFARLELVTREEFEVQQAVLARTRMRLETLEKRVEALESRVVVDADRPAGFPVRETADSEAQAGTDEGSDSPE